MKPFSKMLLTTILGFLLIQIGFAQKGSLKGTVTDEKSGEPIPFLNVYTADKSVGATTDFDGQYTLELEAGTYEIIFSSVEYGKTTKTVTIRSGETTTLNVALVKADIKMETILVKTEKYAKPIEEVVTSMDVIKPNVIENKGATDVTVALEQSPGLTIVDNEPQLRAGSGYSFGAGSRVAILVDDLPLMTGDAGRPSWGYIPIENIEQVEIIKGAASVLYGSAALNGVINVRTAYPKTEPMTRITLNTGVYDAPARKEAKWWEENFPFYSNISFLHSRRVTNSPNDKVNFSFVVGGNANVENGFIGPPPTDAETKVPEWETLRNQGKITQQQYEDSLKTLSKELKKGEFENRARINFNTYFKIPKVKGLAFGINANLMYGRSASSLIWLNNDDGLLRAYPGALTTTLQTTFNVDPYISFFDSKGNKYSFNSRIFYQNNDNDNNQQNQNTVYYGEFRYIKNLQRVKNFTISTGAMGNYVVASSQLFAGNYTQGNIAIYAQMDVKVLDRLTLTAGGRWEYFRVAGDTVPTFSDNEPVGRLGLNLRVARATYFRASFGQGFRFPTIAERYIETTVGGIPIVSNPSLKPEKSWNLEAGLKQGIKIGKFLGYIDVAGFLQQYRDYVEFIAALWNKPDLNRPGSSAAKLGLGFKSQNTNRTRVSGLELTVLGQGNFTDIFALNILAGYTWARPVSLDPNKEFARDVNDQPLTYINSSTDTSNYILKYRYEHLVKADIELHIKWFAIGGSYRYYSFMQNVDAIFYNPLINTLGIDAKGYRDANHHPEHVFDFRISAQIARHSKVSFIVNNAFNREYALRPLVINPPRSYALQYAATF